VERTLLGSAPLIDMSDYHAHVRTGASQPLS